MPMILVLDDEPNIVKLLEMFLKLKGFEVLGAIESKAALEIVQSNVAIDLMIIDMTMPEISGVEFLKKISAINKKIPVLVLSGCNTTESNEYDDLQSIDYKVDAILGKPMDLFKLLEEIKRILSQGK